MTNDRSLPSKPILAALLTTVIGGAGAVALAQAPAPTIPERVAALKESLAKSAATLKQYEWIETTAISLNGELKSSKQNRCYYGADGKKQEVPITATPEKEMRGIRGKIAADKKDELSDYMKQAVALLKTYVPPDPARLEAAKNAGKVSITPLEPGKRVRLDFKDYQKAGDTLSVEINPVNNTLLGLKVNTWLQDAKDVVSLDVKFGALNDGTSYAETIVLDAPSQKLAVNVGNSGYRKA
jgi:hypothetical protein